MNKLIKEIGLLEKGLSAHTHCIVQSCLIAQLQANLTRTLLYEYQLFSRRALRGHARHTLVCATSYSIHSLNTLWHRKLWVGRRKGGNCDTCLLSRVAATLVQQQPYLAADKEQQQHTELNFAISALAAKITIINLLVLFLAPLTQLWNNHRRATPAHISVIRSRNRKQNTPGHAQMTQIDCP